MKQITIGRHRSNDHVINAEYVSGKHAVILQKDNGDIIIQDVGSKNGTFVNGERIQNPTLLKLDDVVFLARKEEKLRWQAFFREPLSSPVAVDPSLGTVFNPHPNLEIASLLGDKKQLTIFQATPDSPKYEVASRESRFWAAALDVGAFYAPYVPILVAITQNRDGDILSGIVVAAFIALVAVVFRQMMLLAMFGQTVGKKALNIKIVRKSDGENGGFGTNVVIRWFLFLIPNAALLGLGLESYGPLILISAFYFIDIVFIFQNDYNQCLHDYLANTIVVNKDQD